MTEAGTRATVETADGFVSWVQAGPENIEAAKDSWGEARDLVTGYLGQAVTISTIPESVKARAILETASELYHRKSAPNGVAAFADGTPLRVARDPMVGAYPLLNKFLVPL